MVLHTKTQKIELICEWVIVAVHLFTFAGLTTQDNVCCFGFGFKKQLKADSRRSDEVCARVVQVAYAQSQNARFLHTAE